MNKYVLNLLAFCVCPIVNDMAMLCAICWAFSLLRMAYVVMKASPRFHRVTERWLLPNHHARVFEMVRYETAIFSIRNA